MELELTVKRTLDDVEKMKVHIQSILDALIKNSHIVEVGLSPILDEEEMNSSNTEDESSPKTKPMKDLTKFNENGQIASKTTYSILDSETFLIPFIDKWIWGTTVVNTSEFAAELPELHLMVANTCDDYQNSCFWLSYTYSVSLVEVPIDFIQNEKLNNFVTIPFHDIFKNGKSNPDHPIQVQSGCKAMVTASFSHPLRNLNKVPITTSIFCNKIHQWSTVFEIKNVHAFTLYNENVLKKFRPQILSVLTAQHIGCFKIERRFSQTHKSPSKVFQKFLAYLGFDVINTVQTGLDTWIDILTSEKPTLLFGILIKMERNNRDIDSSQCSIASRSSEQMYTFLKLFSSWINQESSEDRKRGLKGLLISSINEKGPLILSEQLAEEIDFIEHLINLNDRHLLTSTKFLKKWLMNYLPFAAQTDSHFMQRT